MISFAWDVADAIWAIKESVLPHNKHNEYGVYISFNVDASYQRFREMASLHFIIYDPYGSVHTYGASGEWMERNIVPENFLHLSSHSTCWRDAVREFCYNKYFKMCDKLNVDIARSHKRQQRPADINTAAHIILEPVFRIIKVEQKDSPEKYGKILSGYTFVDGSFVESEN